MDLEPKDASYFQNWLKNKSEKEQDVAMLVPQRLQYILIPNGQAKVMVLR